ncbi:MAG TPA: biotin/lipoyl-binding protein [Candidatus Fimivicinus intestinavium]|nr:biotin/lipoyl-binding protein [Candidatus Fimivicinus intestinavium]
MKAVRELEKFKALSKGKKTAVIVGAIAVVLAIALVIYFLVRPEPGTPVTLVSVQQGDIQQELIASGTVESDNQTNFSLLEGTKVLTVNVKVGDHVKKGDVLATFDASSLSGKLSERRAAYNEALQTYNNSLTAASEAKAKLPQVNADIAELEKKIEALTQQAQAAQTTTQAAASEQTQAATEATTTPNTLQGQIQAIIDKLLGANGTVSQIQKLMEQLTQMAENGFDLSSMASSASTELIQAQMDLAQLKIQKTTLEAQQNGTLSRTYKLVVDASKKSLDEMEAMVESLRNGWVAEDDGVVTAVNITAGETYQGGGASAATSSFDISSILQAVSGGTDLDSLMNTLTSLGTGANVGMTVENYGQFYASFSLDKYDVLKVKTGMPAVITTASGDLDGEVSFISPVASSGGGLDLSNLAGSLTGAGSSSSIPAKVKINNPDASVIIGVDVDIAIQTDEAVGATLIPLESLLVEEGKKYVFIYNEEEGTVAKTEVETGLVSDTMYQILSGVSVGDHIVRTPSKTLADGARVTVQEEGESVVSSETN